MAEGMSGFVTPTVDLNGGNNCGDGWGNWGGALIGGAIGGAVGAGWNGNRNGNGNCCNPCCGDNYIMDTLTTMRTDINSIGRDNLMQTAGVQSAMCQGFGGVNASVERVGAANANAASRIEAAVLTTGLQGQLQAKDNTISSLNAAHAAEVQGMRNTFDLKSSIDGCCCETNRNIERQGCDTRAVITEQGCQTRTAIHAEGEATRALIAQIDRERLLREMGAKDARIAALEAQQFNSALAAGTAQQARNDLNAAMTNIIGHMAAFRGTTTTPAAAAA